MTYIPGEPKPARAPAKPWLIAALAAGSAVALVGIVVLIVSLTDRGSPEVQSRPVTVFSDCPFAAGGCPGAHPTPSPTAAPISVPPVSLAPPSPVPAWVPCNCDADFLVGDTCDAAAYSNQDGSLLDAFIENKDFVKPDRLKDCPQFLPTWQRALTGFTVGVQIVGKDVKPGRYETTSYMTGGKVVDCYWERSRNGAIVANNFVSGASKVTVTIAGTDDAFTSRGCGDWVKVG